MWVPGVAAMVPGVAAMAPGALVHGQQILRMMEGVGEQGLFLLPELL